ncbi:MAG: hypothetical protein IJT16_01865 [Lachnospiraceae bacterium]|nr:hypothetical protein [Lachnospiraceae bacterium]
MRRLLSNETLAELLTGIGVWGILVLIVVLIVSERKLYGTVGLIVGIGLAAFYAVNLYTTIDASLELDEKGATAYTRKKYLIRYLVVCIVYIALALTDIGSLFSCFAGILGIKIGAYLQPFVRKYIYKRIDPPGEALPSEDEAEVKEAAGDEDSSDRIRENG